MIILATSDTIIFDTCQTSYRLRHSAYPAIVGSGLNSAILHYSANNRLIGENDLVLVDAGGEFHCYASDITRKSALSYNINFDGGGGIERVVDFLRTLVWIKRASQQRPFSSVG